jgi:hypothetical protein
MSLLIGALGAVGLATIVGGWGLLIFPIAALAYPIMGAIVISWCQALRNWAHEYDVEEWTKKDKIWLGAVWPISIVCCLIIYIFLGIINRMF